MKRLILILLITAALLVCVAPAVTASAATDFTGWTPISSGADFAKIASGTSSTPNKYYLTQDITVSSTINSGWDGAAISNVIIDGNGKTINLSCSLFNRLSNVTVQNVKLKGKIVWNKSPFQKSPLTSGNNSGGNGKVILTNVSSDVDMEVCFDNRYKRLSGVIHYTGSGSVLTNVSCTGSINVTYDSDASVEKIEDVGGLVGTAKTTTFVDCSNSAPIFIDTQVNPGNTNEGAPLVGSVGGIAGETSSCTFTRCTNSGDITVESIEGKYYVGGIAAMATGNAVFTDCTNSGDISASACTDGIKGCQAYRATQTNCSNTGRLEINYDHVAEKKGSCTVEGVRAHYECRVCGDCFDDDGRAVKKHDLYLGYSHRLSDLVAERGATCIRNGMKAHYYCNDCGAYFDTTGEETLKFFLETVATDHTYKHVPASGLSCDGDETLEHYCCIVCNKYFDLSKNEVDKSEVILGEGTGHDLGAFIAKVPPTLESEGMSAHYECSRCGKLFDRMKNECTRAELTIPKLEPEPEIPETPEDPETPDTPITPEQPDGPTGDNDPPAGGNNNNDNNDNSDNNDQKEPDGDKDKNETEAPSDSAPADSDSGDGDKGGCGSTLCGGIAVL